MIGLLTYIRIDAHNVWWHHKFHVKAVFSSLASLSVLLHLERGMRLLLCLCLHLLVVVAGGCA